MSVKDKLAWNWFNLLGEAISFQNAVEWDQYLWKQDYSYMAKYCIIKNAYITYEELLRHFIYKSFKFYSTKRDEKAC